MVTATLAAVTLAGGRHERYCRDQLGMGSPEFVLAEPVGSVIEVAEACRRGQGLHELKQAAQRRGALHLHPYMGIEAVWALALDLEQQAKVPVQVIAAAARDVDRNDKGQLTQLIDAVIGPSARAAGEQGRDFSQLAFALGALSGRCERVAPGRARAAPRRWEIECLPATNWATCRTTACWLWSSGSPGTLSGMGKRIPSSASGSTRLPSPSTCSGSRRRARRPAST